MSCVKCQVADNCSRKRGRRQKEGKRKQEEPVPVGPLDRLERLQRLGRLERRKQPELRVFHESRKTSHGFHAEHGDAAMKNPLDRIALVLTGGERGSLFRQALAEAGWVELRVDCFLSRFPANLVLPWARTVRDRTRARIIGTVRRYQEQGGQGKRLSDPMRHALYEEVLPYVDLVDVEVRSSIAPEVMSLAHRRSRKVILSFHDFKRAPDARVFQELYGKARNLGADILKIAFAPRTGKESVSVLEFMVRNGGRIPLIVVPMGVPPLERLIPLCFGSLLTYVSMGTATAPGQISFSDMRRYMRVGLFEQKGSSRSDSACERRDK